MSVKAINALYREWKVASEDKDRLLTDLVKLLDNLGRRICWTKIPDLEKEFGQIVYDAIWRAIKNEKDFEGKSEFSTWFYKIVVNECNRALGEIKRVREHSLESLDDNERTPGSDNLAALFFRGMQRKLSEPDRVLLARKATGLTSKEISGELGISPAAVDMRWKRLKERLRSSL